LQATRTMRPLYLDYNATTPLDPRVFEAMRPYFIEEPGNAGSRTHVYGQLAKDAVDRARRQVADLLGVRADQIVFTSGATESNNLVILGLRQYGLESNRRHVLSTAIEHKSVLEPLDHLRQAGFEVDSLPVAPGGYVEPETVRRLLRPDTLLVSIMHANNETGVLQPVREVAKLLAGGETLYHVDAAQTFGKEVQELRELATCCDFLSISGHKIYGPKGARRVHSARSCTGAVKRWVFARARCRCPSWLAWVPRLHWREPSTRRGVGSLRRLSSISSRNWLRSSFRSMGIPHVPCRTWST
jgi:cysteine desulfurase